MPFRKTLLAFAAFVLTMLPRQATALDLNTLLGKIQNMINRHARAYFDGLITLEATGANKEGFIDADGLHHIELTLSSSLHTYYVVCDQTGREWDCEEPQIVSVLQETPTLPYPLEISIEEAIDIVRKAGHTDAFAALRIARPATAAALPDQPDPAPVTDVETDPLYTFRSLDNETTFIINGTTQELTFSGKKEDSGK